MAQGLPTAVFGRTGLEMTRLGYGAMEIRGSRIWGGRPVTEEQAQTILNAVVDAGINFIDTAFRLIQPDTNRRGESCIRPAVFGLPVLGDHKDRPYRKPFRGEAGVNTERQKAKGKNDRAV